MSNWREKAANKARQRADTDRWEYDRAERDKAILFKEGPVLMAYIASCLMSDVENYNKANDDLRDLTCTQDSEGLVIALNEGSHMTIWLDKDSSSIRCGFSNSVYGKPSRTPEPLHIIIDAGGRIYASLDGREVTDCEELAAHFLPPLYEMAKPN